MFVLVGPDPSSQDNMGNDEDSNEKSARGIAGFSLSGGTFATWKVQGKVGGYTE